MSARGKLLSILALGSGLALAGCESMDFMNMFNQKKPLPGERRAVFPEGVPGVHQGVPPDLVRGYQPAPEPMPEPMAEPVKPKPPPRRVAAPARPAAPPPAPPQQQQQQQQQQQSAPSQAAWPAPSPTAQPAPAWPAPSSRSASQPSQPAPAWPDPPSSGTAR